MALGKFDLAAASDVLKEQYDEHEAYKVLGEQDPLIGLIKREEGVLVGKNFKFAIQYGTGRGVATTLAKARLGASTSLYQDVELTRGRVYGMGAIDRETMHTAKSNKAAFVDSIENQQDGLILTIGERLADWAYKNGGGSCGRIATGGISGATLTLDDITDAQNFQENGIYEVANNDGTSGALEAGSLTCVAVDRDTGVVTMSGNITTGVPTAVVGMYLFPAGDHATVYADTYGKRVIVGLDGWIPLTSPTATPFFGLDRSKDPVRLGGCRYNGAGAPIEESVIKALAQFGMQGAKKIDLLLMSDVRLSELIIGLGNRVKYETITGPAKIGFEGITFVGPNGKVAAFGTSHCKMDRVYCLQKDTWRLLTMRKMPEFIEDDGLTIRRARDGSDGYEWEMVGYAQMACKLPGKNGVIRL